GGASRTLETVRHLQQARRGDRFVLVVGADVWRERTLWYGWPELETLVEFRVLGRRGYDGPEPMLPEVSSSLVRERIAAGRDVSMLLGRAVLEYIAEHELYR